MHTGKQVRRAPRRGSCPVRLLHACRVWCDTVLLPFEQEIRVVPRYLDRSRVALDVGANLGLFTHVLARFSKRVVAFEPNPVCAAYLRRVAPPNAEIVEAAASNRTGRAVLRVPGADGEELDAFGSLERDGFAEGGVVREHAVATTTLDEALASRLAADGVLGFAKIDVEGRELAVSRVCARRSSDTVRYSSSRWSSGTTRPRIAFSTSSSDATIGRLRSATAERRPRSRRSC